MRPKDEILTQVRRVVLEIKDFYDRCNHTSNNGIEVSTGMLGYALGLKRDEDVDVVVSDLKEYGHLSTTDPDRVLFASHFLKPGV